MAYYMFTPRNPSETKNLRLRIETEDPLFHGQKKLKLRGLELCEIPNALFNLVELEILDLSPERESCLNYRLLSVPPSIGKLVNLQVLVLDTNELIEIPKEISLLINLERVTLSNNKLSTLPFGFKHLRKLRSLHIANNVFEEFPRDLCELESLEFLDMCDNKLRMIPEQISQLKNLHTLLLFYNKLSILPQSICDMTELHCMWLGNNLLRELPREFGNLVNLDWEYNTTSSTLDGNPLAYPPIDVCRRGPKAIQQYFDAASKYTSSNERDNSWERNGIEGEQSDQEQTSLES